jgi:hypothetical protein
MNEIQTFGDRLKKIGVVVELAGNYPWIYLHKVNGNVVKEKFRSEHAFTLGYYPKKEGDKATFTDLKKIFETIRKYK